MLLCICKDLHVYVYSTLLLLNTYPLGDLWDYIPVNSFVIMSTASHVEVTEPKCDQALVE